MDLQGFNSTFAAMSIEVNNLSKYYGSKPAVDGISFSVGRGEVVGFLGPNGAGKSTTMKIITSYLDGDDGEVRVLGKNVKSDSGWIKRQIGYLPEHNPLYSDLYVHEYLEFTGNLYGLIGKNLRKRVAEMVELCGLTKEQNKKIESLSRGYRQRVGIAQALLHDPPVLVLDEPTSGLDPNQLSEIRQLIKNVSSEKTVLFSTHIMQEVEAICDRVLVINAGKIVANDLLTNLLGNHDHVFIARFGCAADPAPFGALPGIISITMTQPDTLTIFAERADIRPLLFKVVAERNLPLLSLDKRDNSMEEVFRNLTTQTEN